MANNDPSDAGEPAGAAPVPAATSSSSATPTPRRTPSATGQPSAASTTTAAPPLRKQPSNSLLPRSSSPSTGVSPRTSRNASPLRKDSRPPNFPAPPSAAAIQRALSASNVPQISTANNGGVTEAVSKLAGRGGARSVGPSSGETTPQQWPLPPRLRSPPPSNASSRRTSGLSGKKAESSPSIAAVANAGAPPSISVQGAAPGSPATVQAKQGGGEQEDKKVSLQAPAKMPSRGPSGKSQLETVQENSSDVLAEPDAAVQAAAELKPAAKAGEEARTTTPRRNGAEDGEKHTKLVTESESETGGNKSDEARSRRTSNNLPGSALQKAKTGKSGLMPLTTTKSRQTEGTRNMTVETETVTSIPTSGINAGDRSGALRGENSGSIRLKPSNETIRAKKERKKPSQKARSINQGTGTFRRGSPLLLQRGSLDDMYGSTCVSSTMSEASTLSSPSQRRHSQSQKSRNFSQQLTSAIASTFRRGSAPFRSNVQRRASNVFSREASSKADIFEARVASAVDEANTSDSEETFVYESNPPEPSRRPTRHHSRTPSVTSGHSGVDGRSGIRNFNDVLEERRVAGKRSMKFSNNPFHDQDSPSDRQDGTVRSHQPRHYGRWGRGGSHASMFDQDSPFTQASKLRNSATNSRRSQPGSPRSPQSVQHNKFTSGSSLFGGRRNDNAFDFDPETADDERTPLVNSLRTPRRSRVHSSNSNSPSIDEYYNVRRRRRLNPCTLTLIISLIVALLTIAFLLFSTGPMYDVRIDKIQNVLASEQELMLDLRVGAVNPNPLGIMVSEMDVNIFVKSKHVGSGGNKTQPELSVRRGSRRRSVVGSGSGGHDHGTDPMPPDDDDEEREAHTMLLGRISHFDTALSFDGSPIKRHLHFSIGELRLARPGNKTEVGGSERWEEVLKHSFELIVRGTLRYQLPIGSRVAKAAVGASVVVHPEDDVDEEGNMRVEITRSLWEEEEVVVGWDDGWEVVDG